MRRRRAVPSGPLRVLHSAGPSTGTSFLTHLVGTHGATVEHRTFSWRDALRWDVDVLHVHWPDGFQHGRSRAEVFAKRLATLAVLARARTRRTAVVRTLHNVAPHEGGGRLEQLVLRRVDRATDVFVALTPATPTPPAARPDALVTVIPHPDYVPVFAALHPEVGPTPGRLLFFGLIRPYKSVPALVEAFAGLADAAFRLEIAGQPGDQVDVGALRRQAAADPRVELTLAFLSDDDLALAIRRASLVVLPYREMHNSGAALLALSVGRPVLVPAGEVNDALRAEAGEPWVRTYQGSLTATALAEALAAPVPPGRPELPGRDWPTVAGATLAAYRQAIRIAGNGPRLDAL